MRADRRCGGHNLSGLEACALISLKTIQPPLDVIKPRLCLICAKLSIFCLFFGGLGGRQGFRGGGLSLIEPILQARPAPDQQQRR